MNILEEYRVKSSTYGIIQLNFNGSKGLGTTNEIVLAKGSSSHPGG